MRRPGALLLLLAALAGAGCGGRAHRLPEGADAAGPVVGVYRGRIATASGESHRFRLLLYAARPDRVHGELYGPMGATQMIVDGGGGRLAISLPRERTAFVGTDDPAHVRGAFGVELRLDQLVSALLDGVLDVAGYTLVREGASSGALPEALELASEEITLSLTLRQHRVLDPDAGPLGTGTPPPGLRQRPIEELDGDRAPAILSESDPS